MTYAFDAAFANLEQRAEGTLPPKAQQLQIKNPGTPEAAVMMDAYGNGMGGVRSPYVEVPTSVLLTNSPGPGVCREMGREAPFDKVRLQSEYPSPKVYAEKVAQSADRRERVLAEPWMPAGSRTKRRPGL